MHQNPDPPPNVMISIALLAWVTVSEAREYYAKLKKSISDTIQARGRWKDNELYCIKTRELV